MNILVFDTSNDTCTVALSVAGQLYSRVEFTPRAHGQRLLPLIDSVLLEAGITLKNVNAFAYGAGPGSFTGLRLASAVVQGFGLVVPALITPISTLAAIAQSVYLEHGKSHCLVAMDARMGEVYAGFYACNAQGVMTAVVPEQISKPEAIIIPQSDAWCGAGDAFTILLEPMSALRAQCHVCVTNAVPQPEALMQLAIYQLKNNIVQSVADVEPCYLRTPQYVTHKQS